MTDKDDDTQEEESEDKPKKSFSWDEHHAEVQRVGSKEKKEGRRIREQEILSELGVDNIDDAKSILSAAKKAEDDAKDELTKEREKAAKEAAAAQKDREEAARERMLARAERHLVKQGLAVPDDDKEGKTLDRALRLLGDLSHDADEDTIAQAVEDLKKDVPAFFSPPAGEQEPPKPKVPGVPFSPKGDTGNKPTTHDMARSVLEQRHPEKLAAKDKAS